VRSAERARRRVRLGARGRGDAMDARGLVLVGVLLGLLVAAGLALVLVRGGQGRRGPMLVALTAVLLVTASGGLAWVRMGMGGGSPAPLGAAPVPATLTLYAERPDCSAGGDCATPHALVATRADDGSVRWELTLPKGAFFTSDPLVQNGIVFAYISSYPGAAATVGATTAGARITYVLAAWRGRDGAELWHTALLAPCCRQAPRTYVADDEVVVVDATPAGGDAPPAGGDAPPAGGDAPPAGGDAPHVDHLLRLRAGDGAVLGTTALPAVAGPLPEAAGLPPAVAGDTVYKCLPTGATIMAVRLGDGAPIWSASWPGPAASTRPGCSALRVAGGVVFASGVAASGPLTNQLVALDAASGRELWSYATPTSDPLAVGDGLVVLGEGDHYDPASIVALRAGDGTLAWRHGGFPPEPPFPGCPRQGVIPLRTAAIGGGLVLVGGGGYTLWALRADDGSPAWQVSADRHSYSTVGVAGGAVFVRSLFIGCRSIISLPFSGDEDSHIAALRARDGVPYWQTTPHAIGGLVMDDV
jgi:outer membrane protein assembly factor BamB